MSAQYPPPAASAGPANGKAIAAMVLGIVGMVTGISFLGPFAVVFSIASLVLGIQAKKEIAASGGAPSGAGMATAGIVLGWIGIGFTILAILLFLVAGAALIGFAGSS